MKKDEGYISKADCMHRGFVKKSNGIYKMSVLEKYAEKGWLSFGDPKYSKEDRLKAAARLQKDYEKSYFMASGVSFNREKVDSCGKNADDIESLCRARKRYAEAVHHIPGEFWNAVKTICLENKDFDVSKMFSPRRRMEISYALKCDLCRGLDRLIRFYWSV